MQPPTKDSKIGGGGGGGGDGDDDDNNERRRRQRRRGGPGQQLGDPLDAIGGPRRRLTCVLRTQQLHREKRLTRRSLCEFPQPGVVAHHRKHDPKNLTTGRKSDR